MVKYTQAEIGSVAGGGVMMEEGANKETKVLVFYAEKFVPFK